MKKQQKCYIYTRVSTSMQELLEDECPFLLSQGKGADKKWQGRKKCVHQRITSRVQVLY